MDRVAPWLFLGPALDAAGYRSLREQGVTHVVDLRDEDEDDPNLMESLGFRWLRLPIPDRKAPAPGQIEELRAWLAADRGVEGESVLYLHCRAGLGRTPTVAIALLMHEDMPLRDAHRQVRAARPGAQPTAAQDAYLEDLATRIKPSDSR